MGKLKTQSINQHSPVRTLALYVNLALLVMVFSLLLAIPSASATSDKEPEEPITMPIVDNPNNGSEPDPAKPDEALPPPEQPDEPKPKEEPEPLPASDTEETSQPASRQTDYRRSYSQPASNEEDEGEVAGVSTDGNNATPVVSSTLTTQVNPAEPMKRSNSVVLTGVLSAVVILSMTSSFAFYLARVQEDL